MVRFSADAPKQPRNRRPHKLTTAGYLDVALEFVYSSLH